MSLLENISNDISYKIGIRLNKNNEEIEVINYGLFAILHITITLILLILIGLLTDTIYEMIIISLSSAIVKRYSGGVHATSPSRCTIISILLSWMLAKLAIQIIYDVSDVRLIYIMIISFIITYIVIYIKCPVGTVNKPLKNESTRKRLRKKAFALINTMLIVSILLLSLYIKTDIISARNVVILMLLGMLLQVFVLTSIGRNVIEMIDKGLKIVI